MTWRVEGGIQQSGRWTFRRRVIIATGVASLITILTYYGPDLRQLLKVSRTVADIELLMPDAAEPEGLMPRSTDPDQQQTLRFHEIVSDGDLQALRAALEAGAEVNAPGHVGATALMVALDAKDLAKVELLIQHGADPELTDDFNHTALHHAVSVDFADGVRFLLGQGVDRGYTPKYPLKKLDHHFELPDSPMPVELREHMSEEQWRQASAESNRRLQELWQTPTVEPAISAVESVEVLKLFLAAGDDLSLAPSEVQRSLIGLKTGGELTVATAEYRTHKSPRYGSRNPERMDLPFWQDMIRTGANAYFARTKFGDNEPFTNPGVVWCFDRFGSSLTPLEDGRFVQIGGEHEDFYDPDFHIYNDLVVHDGRGNFEVYGYPREIFPPTDFHTATLCADGIYIVGCLGNTEQRQAGLTPVYHVTLESWEIRPVKTGGELPGWIHKHRARFLPERNAIRIIGGEIHTVTEDGKELLLPNDRQYELDLSQLSWRQIRS